MTSLRKIAEAAFILLMAAGAMFAIYLFNAAVDDYLDMAVRYGARGWQINGTHILAIGGAALAEFAATAAFAIQYARRGSHIAAPAVYLWTYAALGAASGLLLLWAARNVRVADLVWFVPMFLACGILIAAPGLAWLQRYGRTR